MNINLDQIPVERKEFRVEDISAIVKRFICYRDWDNLVRYVLHWGISFHVVYWTNRRGYAIPYGFDVLILKCREWPYYNYIEPKTRKDLKGLVKSEARR